MEFDMFEREEEYHPKLCLGSNSTFDGDANSYEPVVAFQANWIDCICEETDFHSCRFCPKCLGIVELGSAAKMTYTPRDQIYYSHKQCQIQEQFITEFAKSATKIQELPSADSSPGKIGSRQFLIALQLNHPLNLHKFYSGCSKLLQNQSSQVIQDLTTRESNMFGPNKVLIPITEFTVSVIVECVSGHTSPSSSNKKVLKFKVDLSKEKEGKIVINFNDGEIDFSAEFQILCENELKKKEIDNFNLKYPYFYEKSSLVKMNKYVVSLCAEEEGNLSKRGECQMENIGNYSPYSNYGNSPQLYELDPPGGFNFEQIQQNQEETRLFIDRVKTQIGSKEFQKKAKNMTFEEVEESINKVLPHLSEVVLNDYANYMLQSLLGVCSFEQRVRIIESARKQLVELVCSQQGTFVFQQLIGYLTKTEQFELICEIVAPENYKLFIDGYGNHFMRKLIQSMPKHLIYVFMPDVLANFVAFAVNKNAVCVLKCVLRALKQGETIMNEIFYESRKVLDSITLNSRELINDEYGNYIIQEAYDIFPMDRMTGITEYIIKNFSRCACEKYSSNVLQNCVRKYWPRYESVFKSLKNCLENKNITYMYYNKEGNKILLEIMSLQSQLTIQDKIRSLIMYEQSSKFNSRRWNQVIGRARTGAVGTHYSSFSDAHHQQPKRKHYK